MFEGYKIQIGFYVDYKVKVFLESLRIQYHRRFDDSGLFGLENMISDYEKRTKLLGEDIVNKIFDFLGFGALGRLVISRTKEFEEFKFMFSINSYSITLFCKALYKEKIIVVDDIFITN